MTRTRSIYVGHDQLSTLAPRLYRLWQHTPGTFWLDSAFSDDGLGRYSYLGTNPSLRLETTGNTTSVRIGRRRQTFHDDPFQVLSRVAAPFLAVPAPTDDIPFTGGLVGYVSYDLSRYGKDEAGPSPRKPAIDGQQPLLSFGYYDAIVGLDHETGYIHLCTTGLDADGRPLRKNVPCRLSMLEDAVAQALAADYTPPVQLPPGNWRDGDKGAPGPLHSNFTRDEYVQTVRRVLGDISEGSYDQVNIAQRFNLPFTGSAAALYERLRRITPAPYGALLSDGARSILSSSPELFLKIKDDLIEMRPIKGTRPRGHDATTDDALRRELLASKKDAAEHMMIVNLQLDELSALCRPGTVHVAERMTCEQYATVFHLVSTLRGQLLPETDKVAAFASLFPGGSITGTPKAAAIKAIARHEPDARGIYTGSIGYIGAGGAMGFNVAIRTIIIEAGQAHFHVGGAIVSQSSPEAEYDETLDKAEGMVQALVAART